jgi:cytochrome c556
MSSLKTHLLLSSLTAALALAATACGKTADVDPALAAVQHERHEGFEKMGDAFKSIMDGLKAGKTLDAEMTAAAETIDGYTSQIGDWFPAGTGEDVIPKSRAKVEIWAQPEVFAEKREAFIAESHKFVALAKAGDAEGFAAQAKALGGSCKGCHDNFRSEEKH